jgi:hypothetical protein
MTIVTSVVLSDEPQEAGRRLIRERHTDHLGVVYEHSYRALTAVNAETELASYAVLLADRLAELEFASLLEGAPYVLNHQTATQLGTRIRNSYKLLSKVALVKVAALILARISDGTYTDLQVRNVFGLTAGQWTTLKQKMIDLVAHWTAIEAAVGE